MEGNQDLFGSGVAVENRLVTATRTGDKVRHVAHYAYDAFGRRIAKQDQNLPNDRSCSCN